MRSGPEPDSATSRGRRSMDTPMGLQPGAGATGGGTVSAGRGSGTTGGLVPQPGTMATATRSQASRLMNAAEAMHVLCWCSLRRVEAPSRARLAHQPLRCNDLELECVRARRVCQSDGNPDRDAAIVRFVRKIRRFEIRAMDGADVQHEA